ncbi:MAG: hypothetical protein ABIS06_10935, partial [Vicinamibacterales bacterium]
MQRCWVWIGLAVVIGTGAVASGSLEARAQAAAASCDAYLLPQREVNGKKVGPASCMGQETQVTLEGRPYVRMDLGIDGTVEGFITKTGDYKEYLTNAPDLVFPQTADDGERFLGIAAYERA